MLLNKLLKLEEALKQKELEYRERMNTATSGIEQNISTADKKAKSVNNELDKIKKAVTVKNVNKELDKIKKNAPETESTKVAK